MAEAILEEVKKLTPAEKRFNRQKENIKEVIIAATEKLANNNKFQVQEPTNPKLLAVSAALSTLTGSSSYMSPSATHLRALCEALLGEKLPAIKPGGGALFWTKFSALIKLENGPNGDNYPIGQASIIIKDATAIRPDGTTGNTFYAYLNNSRPATVEEIEKIPDEVYAAIIREFVVA